ncbi:mitochondrial import inner membrane translocase subunit TIM17 [Acrasis kona]|uniref:Mitochondrial import inner membrane translocase subunit TIM17 n=1 Tax=Acrasis kona TaxID=1008807 RepID=A0AAW2YIP2_9EUKA
MTNERNPCPYRVYEDVSVGFMMGTVLGSGFHFLKGVKNGARGERFRNGMLSMQARGPVLGGVFAVWGGMFSSCECLYTYIFGREDMVGAIASGAVAGGVLAMRGGAAACARSAMIGAIFLGMTEGANILLQRYMASKQQEAMGVPEPPFIKHGEKIPYFKTFDHNLEKEFDFVGPYLPKNLL